MTPLERACIAVIDELRKQGDLMPDCGDPEWAQVDGAFRVEPVVRAVLTAIREPSEGMAKEIFLDFYSSGDEPEDNIYADPDEAKKIWQAMIDAALSQGSTE